MTNAADTLFRRKIQQAGDRPPHALRRADLLAAAVLLAGALITRAQWFGNPVADFDEQLYSLIGWQITQGQLPFVDQWDRKPFGLFLIFAVIHTAFGPGELAYQLVASCSALTGAWLVYLLARNLVDRVSACVAGVLYLALLSAYGSYSTPSGRYDTRARRHVGLRNGLASEIHRRSAVHFPGRCGAPFGMASRGANA